MGSGPDPVAIHMARLCVKVGDGEEATAGSGDFILNANAKFTKELIVKELWSDRVCSRLGTRLVIDLDSDLDSRNIKAVVGRVSGAMCLSVKKILPKIFCNIITGAPRTMYPWTICSSCPSG